MAVVRHGERPLGLFVLPQRGNGHIGPKVEVNGVFAAVGFAVVFLAVAHSTVVGDGVAATVHVAVVGWGVGVIGTPPVERSEMADWACVSNIRIKAHMTRTKTQSGRMIKDCKQVSTSGTTEKQTE